MASRLEQFRGLLPEKLTIEIHREGGEFWAKVKELPGCSTQGDSFIELIDMINDAIYTYLDIPTKYIQELGYYLPKEVYDELVRRRWQKLIQEMLSKNQQKKFSETFKLSAPVR